MKKNVVLAAAMILLAFAVISCGGSPTVAKVAVPVTPILVTEDTPTPTPTPTVAPSPTPTPLPVACQSVELSQVTDDPTKFKGIAELAKLGELRALPSGERVFTVLMSGSAVVIAEMEAPTPIVVVSRGSESSQANLVFIEKQVYAVRMTCISEGAKALTEEVRFFFAGNVPYLYFP